MKKNLFLAALAFVALASCTSDEFVGGNTSPTTSNTTDGAISFDSGTPAITRADKTGASAAGDLNNQFVVFGYKTMSDDSKQTVFDNYQANYVDNSALTSTTNSAGWEYVGYKNISANMTTNVGVTAFSALTGEGGANENAVDQTIKYWDYSASNYKFYAYSLGAGKTSGEPATITYANGSTMSTSDTYTLEGDQNQLAACYISELKTISDPSGSTPTEVDLRFLSIKSKIQLGFYETIPGYSVKLLKFYDSSTDDTSDGTPVLFAGSSTLPKAGTYTVTFDGNGKPLLAWAAAASDGTQANVAFTSVPSTELKQREYKEVLTDDTKAETADENKVYLGRSSDAASKTEVKDILPYADGAELTLKVDYTLVSRDGSGETIEVKGATAKVPAAYTQWKPNYAYTYLFKISDNTNGQVGEVTGLYPITLDAIVLDDASGIQETITTVSEPSITTFGTRTVSGKTTYVSGGSEYTAEDNIYVTVMDNGSVATPTLGTNVNVYLAQTSDATNFPITEASVAASIAESSAGTKKVTVTTINTQTTPYFSAVPAKATEVPSEDGKFVSNAVELSTSPEGWPTGYYTDKGCIDAASDFAAGTYYQKFTDALKLTGVAATTTTTALVVEYINGKAYTPAAETAVNDGTWFTDVQCTTPATGTANGSTTYFKRENKTYKVIKVASGS